MWLVLPSVRACVHLVPSKMSAVCTSWQCGGAEIGRVWVGAGGASSYIRLRSIQPPFHCRLPAASRPTNAKPDCRRSRRPVCAMASTVRGTSGRSENKLDPAVGVAFADLDQGGKVMAEYVWIGGTGADLRSKTRTLQEAPKSVEDLPTWNYDGSSTGQAPGDDSEVYLKPVRIFKDPFRRGDNILVLCDAYAPPKVGETGEAVSPTPIPTNSRYPCNEVMKKAEAEEPWFGIEQEYTLLESETGWPLGWPVNGYPGPQGPYYCSAGAGFAIGRDLVEAHYKACLFAGINISGVNAEVMPAQWEYQVGRGRFQPWLERPALVVFSWTPAQCCSVLPCAVWSIVPWAGLGVVWPVAHPLRYLFLGGVYRFMAGTGLLLLLLCEWCGE